VTLRCAPNYPLAGPPTMVGHTTRHALEGDYATRPTIDDRDPVSVVPAAIAEVLAFAESWLAWLTYISRRQYVDASQSLATWGSRPPSGDRKRSAIWEVGVNRRHCCCAVAVARVLAFGPRIVSEYG
jgi:hypothetical protein